MYFKELSQSSPLIDSILKCKKVGILWAEQLASFFAVSFVFQAATNEGMSVRGIWGKKRFKQLTLSRTGAEDDGERNAEKLNRDWPLFELMLCWEKLTFTECFHALKRRFITVSVLHHDEYSTWLLFSIATGAFRKMENCQTGKPGARNFSNLTGETLLSSGDHERKLLTHNKKIEPEANLLLLLLRLSPALLNRASV